MNPPELPTVTISGYLLESIPIIIGIMMILWSVYNTIRMAVTMFERRASADNETTWEELKEIHNEPLNVDQHWPICDKCGMMKIENICACIQETEEAEKCK